MSHPDFRVKNRIFATLAYPDSKFGMMRLTPEQQADVMRQAPDVFQPAAGAWGRNGATLVLLSGIKPAKLRPILRQAYDNLAARNINPRRG
jgi:hypothetical protein